MRRLACILLSTTLLAAAASPAQASSISMAEAKRAAQVLTREHTGGEFGWDHSTVHCRRVSGNDVRCRLRYFVADTQVCSVLAKLWRARGRTRSRYIPGSHTGNGDC